jgi:hypothetical protein
MQVAPATGTEPRTLLETASASTWHQGDRAEQRWHLSQLFHGLAGPHRAQAHGLDIRRLVTCSFGLWSTGRTSRTGLRIRRLGVRVPPSAPPSLRHHLPRSAALRALARSLIILIWPHFGRISVTGSLVEAVRIAVHLAWVQVPVEIQRRGDAGMAHGLLEHLRWVPGLDHQCGSSVPQDEDGEDAGLMHPSPNRSRRAECWHRNPATLQA